MSNRRSHSCTSYGKPASPANCGRRLKCQDHRSPCSCCGCSYCCNSARLGIAAGVTSMIGAAPPLTAPWRATRSYTIRSSLRCTVIFQAMADVTTTSSCCHATGLFVYMEMGSSAHFGALRGDVVAVYCEECGFAVQIRRVVAGGDFALLPRQQRKIISRPENGRHACSVFSFGDAQMHHEGEAAARIAHGHADACLATLLFRGGLNVQLHLRQRVEAGQIAELRLRRVHRIFLVLPVQDIRPCR